MLYALCYMVLIVAWFLDLLNVVDLPVFSLLNTSFCPFGNILYYVILAFLPSPEKMKERREKKV